MFRSQWKDFNPGTATGCRGLKTGSKPVLRYLRIRISTIYNLSPYRGSGAFLCLRGLVRAGVQTCLVIVPEPQPRLINGEARAKAAEIELEASKLVKAWRVEILSFKKDRTTAEPYCRAGWRSQSGQPWQPRDTTTSQRCSKRKQQVDSSPEVLGGGGGGVYLHIGRMELRMYCA